MAKSASTIKQGLRRILFAPLILDPTERSIGRPLSRRRGLRVIFVSAFAPSSQGRKQENGPCGFALSPRIPSTQFILSARKTSAAAANRSHHAHLLRLFKVNAAHVKPPSRRRTAALQSLPRLNFPKLRRRHRPSRPMGQIPCAGGSLISSRETGRQVGRLRWVLASREDTMLPAELPSASVNAQGHPVNFGTGRGLGKARIGLGNHADQRACVSWLTISWLTISWPTFSRPAFSWPSTGCEGDLD
jgi:hypothetical protein